MAGISRLTSNNIIYIVYESIIMDWNMNIIFHKKIKKIINTPIIELQYWLIQLAAYLIDTKPLTDVKLIY